MSARDFGQTIALRDSAPLTCEEIAAISHGRARLALGPVARDKLENGRLIVRQIMAKGERAYGITTGLGALSDVLLDPIQMVQVSRNTLLSHACGVGEPLHAAETRSIMVALVNDMCHGYSGVSPAVVGQLVDFLNHGINPVVPSQGSVGYIVHGAHIGLALLGIGDVDYAGRRMSASEAIASAGLQPIDVLPKDGLSLVNGTRCLAGLSCLGVVEAARLADWADIIAALSFEALKGQTDAFDEEVLNLKPHAGAVMVGKRLRSLLRNSEVVAHFRGHRTQDALSLRSIPQVHGATRDQLDHARKQIVIELKSATDNPLVIGTPSSYRVISNAHPHGQSVAMAVDLMALAVAELGSIAERRIDRLLNPATSGLPAFLVKQPGVNSGLMIVQYVAASLAAENKRLSQPAVADNYVTSAQQEDHISLGTPGALKALKVIDNTRRILAIEYLCATQAIEFLPKLKLGEGTGTAYHRLRSRIPSMEQDRFLSPDIAQIETRMLEPDWLAEVEEKIR
ncbi:MAG: histidine ammonia-lyase [Dongiaceae bacterium]